MSGDHEVGMRGFQLIQEIIFRASLRAKHNTKLASERALLLEPWGAAAEQSSGRDLAQVFIWDSAGAQQESATSWPCVTAVCPGQCLFAVACLKCLWDGSLF